MLFVSEIFHSKLTSANTNTQKRIQCKYKYKCCGKEFVEEQWDFGNLSLARWRRDGSLWARSSIRSWQAFTGIQQAAMINLPDVSQAWSFFCQLSKLKEVFNLAKFEGKLSTNTCFAKSSTHIVLPKFLPKFYQSFYQSFAKVFTKVLPKI